MTEQQVPYIISRRRIEISDDLMIHLSRRIVARAWLIKAAYDALPILQKHAPALAAQLAHALSEYAGLQPTRRPYEKPSMRDGSLDLLQDTPQ